MKTVLIIKTLYISWLQFNTKSLTKPRNSKETNRRGKETTMKKSTYIFLILCEQVLQGLTHSIAFLHNALPTVIASAWRVSHQGSATDDALQTFFQRWSGSDLVICQGVHDNLLLIWKQMQGELGRHFVLKLQSCSVSVRCYFFSWAH